MSAHFSSNGDGKPRQINRVQVAIANAQPQAGMVRREELAAGELRMRFRELAALWEDAEGILKELRVPHAVAISYNREPASPNRNYDSEEKLAWMRYGKNWRICHCYECSLREPDEELNWTPVVDSPVDIRIEAIKHFPELRVKVVTAAEQCVPKLDDAIARFRDSLKV